jgi:hypothetical protein
MEGSQAGKYYTVDPVTAQSIRDTMRVLKQIDPTLQRKSANTLKRATVSIIQDARSRIPEVPTGAQRGKPNWNTWVTKSDKSWSASKARRGIKAQVRVGKSSNRNQRPLLKIGQWDPAGAVFDMAGKTGKYTRGRRGAAFNRALPGRASRTMWPAAEARIGEVNAAIEAARDEMEKEINARLGSFAGLARAL